MRNKKKTIVKISAKLFIFNEIKATTVAFFKFYKNIK